MASMRPDRQFCRASRNISRREFALQSTFVAGIALFRSPQNQTAARSWVALVKNRDRREAVAAALALAGTLDVAEKDVYLKANFNSPHPSPATTDPETLTAVVQHLRQQKCGKLALVERSGMGRTRAVWEKLGLKDWAAGLGVELIALEDIPASKWRLEKLVDSHWKRGVEVPDLLTAETCVVQVCNLKTHRFGGHFSASLKNSLGLIAKHGHHNSQYNYMSELHGSPDQRAMIAEVNQIYSPCVVVMDASQVFVQGGPETGELAYPEVIAVSRDRVAIDAVGVALLRLHGAGPPLSRGGVFEQEQLKRAIELNLGAKSVDEIEFLTTDEAGKRLASQITALLEKAPEQKKA